MLNKKTMTVAAVVVVFGMIAYATTTDHSIVDTSGVESVQIRYLE